MGHWDVVPFGTVNSVKGRVGELLEHLGPAGSERSQETGERERLRMQSLGALGV